MKVPSLFFVAGLVVAILSIAEVNAAPVNAAGTKSGNAPWVGCSSSAGLFSATCTNVGNYKTYAECVVEGQKIGWRGPEAWGYCTSLRLK
jgi:hypothetical protein